MPVPPRKPDQAAPDLLSPTGVPLGEVGAVDPRAQAGDRLTTSMGLRVADTDRSLKAGPRGPVLLQDFHLLQKISHFDHEHIPERAVHARGAAAHGTFVSYGTASLISKAAFLGPEGTATPVFTRFSTVLGSRGSADTARDTRGFAVRFYTEQGNFDLVGNNMPVFFVQDAIKFPDLVHAAKPQPDREIPQAQSAHDTFWDFVSQHTEATHHVMWNMSDRGLPRSFRTMEGFGVHTFRLVNEAGQTSLVKFHWKPLAGVHSLLWEEAQLTQGFDPDFHRRDMADGIEAGAPLEWELGVQVMPDDGTETFQGIDLLDPTKLVPEELAAVQMLGKMTLDRNPTNYFAETEQVAYCTSHLVPGIEPTNDPLMQGRMFAYQDTQITRLGGPNWAQLPINRAHASINDGARDGMHQSAIHTGDAAYVPNTLDGDLPLVSSAAEGGYVETPQIVEGTIGRAAPASFDDHFSHATLFFQSLTPLKQAHVVEAYTFELSKCYETSVREAQLRVLANVDTALCEQVAAGLGLPAPAGNPAEVTPSPALSQITNVPGPVAGRKVGVLADAGSDLAGIAKLEKAMAKLGVTVLVIAPIGGVLGAGAKATIVKRTAATARSIEFDALLVAGGTSVTGDIKQTILLHEVFRQCKAIGAWGEGAAVLQAAGIDVSGPGVLVGAAVDKTFTDPLVLALGLHRVWERTDLVTASAVPPSAPQAARR